MRYARAERSKELFQQFFWNVFTGVHIVLCSFISLQFVVRLKSEVNQNELIFNLAKPSQ